MPTKPTLEVRTANTQRDNRWLETVYDQHKSPRFPNGRPWWGYLEYPADKQQDPAFVAELMPGDHNDPHGSGWFAPWYPPQVTSTTVRFFRLDIRARRITWLYSAMIEEDRAANLRYYQAAAKLANQKGWPAPGLGEPISFQIEYILGELPRSQKIPEAALAGDPWLLGMAREPNKVLEALLAGVRPTEDLRGKGVVTAEQMLSTAPDIEAIVARAAAEALAAQAEAQKAANAKRVANLRGKKVSTAAPIVAPV